VEEYNAGGVIGVILYRAVALTPTGGETLTWMESCIGIQLIYNSLRGMDDGNSMFRLAL
jgi:hypothetical protein